MKALCGTILIVLLSAWGLTSIALADPDAPQLPVEDGPIPAGTTFLALDIAIDPQGQPLGAFQFDLTSENASFTVVGVEAGGHPAFDHGRPPYFDPVATQGENDRLILADYARPTLAADQLPTEPVRVATVHVMFTGPVHEHDNPTIQLKLTAAGNAKGERIDATISHTFRTPVASPERPDKR